MSGLLLTGLLSACGESTEVPADDPGGVVERVASTPRESRWMSRDSELSWRPWGAEVFGAALAEDRPVLLYLAGPGCDGLFAGASSGLCYLVAERFIGVRVDPFARPDVAGFFPTGGWPALVALLPDGRPFAMAVDIPQRNVELYLFRLLDAFAHRRDVLEERAAGAWEERFRRGGQAVGVHDTYERCVAAYDAGSGGFGPGGRFVESTALAFLMDYADACGDTIARTMVVQTLAHMVASPMLDPMTGGICNRSYTPGWDHPARDRDAFDQAALASLLLEASRYRPELAASARQLLTYAREELYDPERGAFRGRQVGKAEGGWWTDPRMYAGRNAALVRALLHASRELGEASFAELAAGAGRFLVESCMEADGAVQHVCGNAGLVGRPADQALLGLAMVELDSLDGDPRFRRAAERAIAYLRQHKPARPSDPNVALRLLVEGSPLPPTRPCVDGLRPAQDALVAELYLRLGDAVSARRALSGLELRSGGARQFCGCSRVLLAMAGACCNDGAPLGSP